MILKDWLPLLIYDYKVVIFNYVLLTLIQRQILLYLVNLFHVCLWNLM